MAKILTFRRPKNHPFAEFLFLLFFTPAIIACTIVVPLLIVPILFFFVGFTVLIFALMPLYALFYTFKSTSHPDPDDPPKHKDDIPEFPPACSGRFFIH